MDVDLYAKSGGIFVFERKFVQKDMANIHIYTARKLSDMAGSLKSWPKLLMKEWQQGEI